MGALLKQFQARDSLSVFLVIFVKPRLNLLLLPINTEVMLQKVLQMDALSQEVPD